MTELSFSSDHYLDRRDPAWLTYEQGGLVRYDPFARVVLVSAACGEIVTRLRESVRIPNTMGLLAS